MLVLVSGCVYETEVLGNNGLSTYSIEVFEPSYYHHPELYSDEQPLTEEEIEDTAKTIQKTIERTINRYEQVNLDQEDLHQIYALNNVEVLRGKKNGLKIIFYEVNLSNPLITHIMDSVLTDANMMHSFYGRRELIQNDSVYTYNIYFKQDFIDSMNFENERAVDPFFEYELQDRIFRENTYFDVEVFGRIIETNGEQLTDRSVRFYTLKLVDQGHLEIVFDTRMSRWNQLRNWFIHLFQ